MAEKDMTDLIERLEVFEDRVGVNLEGLYAGLDEDIEWIDLNGEVHPREGTELNGDIELVATVYDSSGRVVTTSSQHFDSDSFFGFEVFSLALEVKGLKPARIRVYPKVS